MILIYTAFQKALGRSVDPAVQEKLTQFYNSHQGIINYNHFVDSGIPWVRRSTSKHDIPAGTRYWASHDKCYVWVPNENLPELTGFTLAILDIVTIDGSRLSPTAPPTFTQPLLSPRLGTFPYPAPPNFPIIQ